VPVMGGFRSRHESSIWPVHAVLLVGLYAGSRTMGPVMQRSASRPRPSSLPCTVITGSSHWLHTAKPGELRLFYCTPNAVAWLGP
jgi:hypothetical protein